MARYAHALLAVASAGLAGVPASLGAVAAAAAVDAPRPTRASLERRFRAAVAKRDLAYAALARSAPATERRLRASCETELGALHRHQVQHCVALRWPHPPGARRALPPVFDYNEADRAVTGASMRLVRSDYRRWRRLRATCEARIPPGHGLDVQVCVGTSWASPLRL